MKALEIEIVDGDRTAIVALSSTGWSVAYNGEFIDALDKNALIAYLKEHGFIVEDTPSFRLVELIELMSIGGAQ